jgi:glutaredoxin
MSSSQQPPVTNSEPTTPELGTPIIKNTTTNITPDPKYVKREITMVGFDDCGHCVDAETYFKTELIPTSDVPVDYKKIIADSDEGKKIVESFKKSKFKSKVNSD